MGVSLIKDTPCSLTVRDEQLKENGFEGEIIITDLPRDTLQHLTLNPSFQ